jgi:hypothetical protein
MEAFSMAEGFSGSATETDDGFRVSVLLKKGADVDRLDCGIGVQNRRIGSSRRGPRGPRIIAGYGIQRENRIETEFDSTTNQGGLTEISFLLKSKFPAMGYIDDKTRGIIAGAGFSLGLGLLHLSIGGLILAPRREGMRISVDRSPLKISRSGGTAQASVEAGPDLKIDVTSEGTSSNPYRLVLRRKGNVATLVDRLEETLLQFTPPYSGSIRWPRSPSGFSSRFLIVKAADSRPIGDQELKNFLIGVEQSSDPAAASDVSQDRIILGDGNLIDYELELATKGFLGEVKDKTKVTVE